MINHSSPPTRNKNSWKGCLITLDGIDQSGKSTQLSLLMQASHRQNIDVITIATNKETPNVVDHLIRDVIDGYKEPLPPKSLAYLFAASGVIRQETFLIPNLELGRVILSDRYIFSGYAYNIAMGIGGQDWNDQLFSYVLPADLAIYIDVSVDTALKRRLASGKKWSENPSETGFSKDENFVENFTNLQTVARNVYLHFVNQGKMIMVDGEQPIDKVHRDIVSIIFPFLKERLGQPC